MNKRNNKKRPQKPDALRKARIRQRGDKYNMTRFRAYARYQKLPGPPQKRLWQKAQILRNQRHS